MSSRPIVAARAAALLFCIASVSTSSSASEFATSVVQASLGPNANPAFPPALALGGPLGGGLSSGSLDVCVLGVGGSITLGFNVVVEDGPGADLAVFENGFAAGGGVFSEVCFVEVSSDGAAFARFPSRYAGPPSQQPAFGVLPMGTFSGLAGGMPVIANVASNAIPPEDAARAGGEAFDLADLAQDPLVLSGAVDLGNVRFVRLVDIPEGQETDSYGNTIWDNGGPTGSADIDAVVVIQHTQLGSGRPVCDLSFDAQGRLELRLGDPDGFFDLDLAELRASFDLVEFSFFSVLPAFALSSFDGKVAHFTTIGPVQGQGITGAFAMSVRDHSGRISTDQAMIQG